MFRRIRLLAENAQAGLLARPRACVAFRAPGSTEGHP